MLRGVKCHICGEIGKHYSSTCSQRVNVGVPVGLRNTYTVQPTEEAQAQHEEVTVVKSEAENVVAGGTFLNSQELTAIIRKSPHIPAMLRCRACLALPQDAIWCQCCDIFACADCLGPKDEAWVCPLCEEHAVDNFHVVWVVRKMIDTWFQSAAELLDPYSVSSDEEDESQRPHSNKRARV